MSNKQVDIESILVEALRRNNAEDRKAYLETNCGSDTELRGEIDSLLRAYENDKSLLKAPSDMLADPVAPVTEIPGTVIDRYKLLEKIGEGGMAVVYMAEQEQPIRRKVALKIIKLGMDTKQVIARFEAERQALALMDHPNIAKVLDAGATDTGRPYFVMELVTGVSITEYCDKNQLSTRDRLGLFIEVCQAVQHAHQKGIIHRDLKPTNILVTQHEGQPVPKVIDFGIAKATNQRLTEKTLFTRYEHIIGTPAYMSPEQAELSDNDIDTRSDIYSLGVLLYELLTGATPFSEEELRRVGYAEMTRIIREEEPPRPSTRLTQTLIQSDNRRKLSTLHSPLATDLDWIVMRALEKQRDRRYDTASAFGLDIQRHLSDEPVLARAPSFSYRFGKYLSRHRFAALLVLAATIIGVVSIRIVFQQKQYRRQLMDAERLRHEDTLSQANTHYARAEREAALETLQPILQSSHVGPEARLLEATIMANNDQSDQAIAILNTLLDDPPEIAAAAHSLWASILLESPTLTTETLREAEAHRLKAETLNPKTAAGYFLQAMMAVTVKEQLSALDEALRLDHKHYGSRRLRAFTYFASRQYEKMGDDALVMTILHERDPLGYSLRAIAWRELKRYPEALADFDNAIVLTSKASSEYVDLCAQRLAVLLRLGHYDRAIADAERCLEFAPDSATLRFRQFCALTALGEYAEATALFRQIINPGQPMRRQFEDWCTTYVFDTLEEKRSWHANNDAPTGAAFLPMQEAEETFRTLSSKAKRVITDGFSADWSPDGKKLAFSAGVLGYSGIAIMDPATKETELLIVPGKDPKWSPDGKHIAFVRDRQNLRLEELAMAERDRMKEQLPAKDEEIWFMKSDGTEPRFLARGSRPSWGRDSEHVYYLSRKDNTLCSIACSGEDAEPRRLMACSYLPSVSADDRFVSYFDGKTLRIKDLISQETAGKYRIPSMTWGVTGWSPTGHEICLGGGNPQRDGTGLWLYDLQKKEALGILNGHITSAAWSPAATELAFCLGSPQFEIWVADLDPNSSTIETLGLGITPDEHLNQMVAFHTRRIEADPQNANAYAHRAHYHDCLNDRMAANIDMRLWSTVTTSALLDMTHPLLRVINLPFGFQIVFSAERPNNTMPMMSIALGQKGKYKMKPLRIPTYLASLCGLCFLTGLDVTSVHADFTFGPATNLGPAINSSMREAGAYISGDSLFLEFTRASELWIAQRTETQDPWDDAVHYGPYGDATSTVALITNVTGGYTSGLDTDDGLESYWYDAPPSSSDLSVVKRATVNADWGPPDNLGPTVNSSSGEYSLHVSADGLTLYFASNRAGGHGSWDLYVTTRPTRSDAWGKAANLGPSVNSPSAEYHPTVSADGLLLFFTSARPGGFGPDDIYMTKRANPSDPWGPAVNLGSTVNSSADDYWPCLSPDGSTLYFTSNRPGGHGAADLWQVPIIPVVDLNNDALVDAADMSIMVDHWHSSDPMCDIAPVAWGDGIVDERDLAVLSEHLEPGFGRIAHWKLDETEGDIAYDSVGSDHANVHGEAVWQPDAGVIDGSLAFDGVDDYIVPMTILNPQDKPFRILAWVKGGEPGQVIASQTPDDFTPGCAYLAADQSDGTLITELLLANMSLDSDVVITDNEWHKVGLEWDGEHRHLQVDGAEAAVDAIPLPALQSTGYLNIGTGKDMEPGSFWSGLMDEVRVYVKGGPVVSSQ